MQGNNTFSIISTIHKHLQGLPNLQCCHLSSWGQQTVIKYIIYDHCNCADHKYDAKYCVSLALINLQCEHDE